MTPCAKPTVLKAMMIVRAAGWALGLGAFVACAGAAGPVVAAFERFHRSEAPGSAVDGGLLLLNELNCVACHAPPEGWRERLPGRGRISLAGVGSRIDAATLQSFVAEPHRFKPGTVMPSVMRSAPAEAEAIAAYLSTLRAPVRSYPAGDAARGGKLFGAVGCAACHAPVEGTPEYPSIPLALARRAEPNALAAFLQDPLHTRPAGRMPATPLSDAEAADLAAYLAGTESRTHAAAASAAQVAAGRTAFVARNCAACHDAGERVAASAALALTALAPERGCLAPTLPAAIPDYALEERQRRALAAALRTVQATPRAPALAAEQRVAVRFEQLNCYACHEWRGRGGAEPARAKYFVANDGAVESLGELGHLPPKLDAAGRKLTPAWLAKLLWGHGGGVRPYMTARMPRFGEAAAGDLVPLLAEACRPEKPETIDVSGSLGHQRFATGRALLGTNTGGLGCVACHGLKGREPSGVRAINLTHTAQRLQPEYFKALLLNPQAVQPGTIMPPLFAGRKNADKEIESIWTYFKELDQSDVLPDGLAVAGSFELKPAVDGRPIVFRTFLHGAGTQAVAVGHPAGVHVAFDSYEVRWALAWRGRFLDAHANWEDRAMPPVKPLGNDVHGFAPVMPLAALRTPAEPWPPAFGPMAGYVFKGYRLAADGVPTFRYEVRGIQVEDTLRPAPDGKSLRRTVVLRAGGTDTGTLFFRGLADPAAPPRPVEWRNGTATIEEVISW